MIHGTRPRAGADEAGIHAGELTWRLLSSLTVRELRLEGASEADRTAVVGRLRDVTRERTAGAADGLFARLAELSGRYAPAAALVTRETLRRDLSGVPLAEPRSFAGAAAGLAAHLPRIRECDPRRLGVHASITVPEVAGVQPGSRFPELPRYVWRDVDDELRDAITDEADHGGVIILVGNSSTGKTRCAFEAIKAVLPDWRLLHPADAAELADIAVSGQLPSGGVVVWLDDLQHYLTGVNALTIDTVNGMLDAGHSTMIIGTIWPEWYEELTRPAPPAGGSNSDPLWHSRRIITGARLIIRLSDFSQQEHDRATALASEDARLEFALQDRDFGPTQVLAGAPQLVERWEHATDPYAKAIITAGIDCDRLGFASPLRPELLRAAAPAYLEDRQVATAPAHWFTTAIDYATEELRGATSALIPVPGPTMGSIAGYKVADYLLQYGESRRDLAPVPDLFWDACIGHATDPDDLYYLASAARCRGRFYYAERAYRLAVNSGHKHALEELVKLLVTQMRFGEAEQFFSRAGYRNALTLTAWSDLLERQGRFEEAGRIYLNAIRAGHPDELFLLSEFRHMILRNKLDPGLRLAFFQGAFYPELDTTHFITHPVTATHLQVLARRIKEDARLIRAVRIKRRVQLARTGSSATGASVPRHKGNDEHAQEQAHGDTSQDGLSAVDEVEKRGSQLKEEGRFEEAEKIYRDAIYHSETALFDLVDMLLEQGREEEAAQAYRDAAKGGHSDALHGLVVLQAWRGRTQDALRIRRYGLDADGETADPDSISRLPPQPELLIPQAFESY